MILPSPASSGRLPTTPFGRARACVAFRQSWKKARNASHAGDKTPPRLSSQARPARCIDALAYKSSRRERYVNVRVETRKHRAQTSKCGRDCREIGTEFSAARRVNTFVTLKRNCTATLFFLIYVVSCVSICMIRRNPVRLHTLYLFLYYHK